MTSPLLAVSNLTVRFALPRRWPSVQKSVHAVDDVSFVISRGTSFGIVGESGSGKSTVALAVMQLLKPSAGSIRVDGVELTALGRSEVRVLRRRMQIVFQDPFSSLNPRSRVETIIREPLDLLDIGTPKERAARVAALLALVGLGSEQRALFPHQFSGGQRQRIAIARALAPKPELLVLDEPVSALDVAIQAQILNQLSRFQQDLALTYLFISHDLSVVRQMCDQIAVMYFGEIVESGARLALFTAPLHPYTRALLASVPNPDPRQRGQRAHLHVAGEPPSPIDPPAGCRFASRCPHVIAQCRTDSPRLRKVGARGQMVRCHRVADSGIAEFDRPPSTEVIKASGERAAEPSVCAS